MRRFLVFVTLLLFVCSSWPVFAASDPSTEALDDTQAMRRERIMGHSAEIWSRTQSSEAVERFLEAQGFEIMVGSVEGETEVLSDPNDGDVALPEPTVAYDPSSQEYLVYYNFRWIDWAWTEDINCQRLCNVGGADAWGIHLSREDVLTRIDQRVVLYDQNGNVTVPNAWYPSQKMSAHTEGFMIEVQDRGENPFWSTPWYNADHGQVFGWYRKVSNPGFCPEPTPTDPYPSCDVDVYFRSAWAHTWNETNITGIGVGADMFSVNFDNDSWGWGIWSRLRKKHTFSF